MIETTKQQRVAALGAIGGIGIGKMAYDHLVVRGTTSEERRQMLLYGASMAAAGALIYLLGLDKKYVMFKHASKAIEQELESW